VAKKQIRLVVAAKDVCAVRYTGDGAMFISGAPTRDLTAAEWAALDDHSRGLCLATKLYVLAGDTPETQQAADGAAEEG
jgi:hypothetical protein